MPIHLQFCSDLCQFSYMSSGVVLRLGTPSCLTLCGPMNCSPPTKLLNPWNSAGKNTRVGCHAFLQGIFPTQGSKPGLLHCRWIFYHLSHQGCTRILEWLDYPFSRGSSQPRNQTRLSCTADIFFTSRAIREALPISIKRDDLHKPISKIMQAFYRNDLSEILLLLL